METAKEFLRHPVHVSYAVPTIKKIVDSLPLAIKRVDNFWTVGSASYKDRAVRTKQEYEQFVSHTNNQLLDIFPDMYRFLLDLFSHTLSTHCEYMPGVSIPGFHVFKYCKEFQRPLARAHVDIPFNKFDWGARVGEGQIFTAVIPLEIPENAGMYVWDITNKDVAEKGVGILENTELHKTPPVALIGYNVDEMIFHSGTYVHQIKPFEKETDKWRITLQMHAVLMDDIWYIYW